MERQGCGPAIKQFWSDNHLNPSTDFIPDPDDVWRCWTCGRGYKTECTLAAHITRSHKRRIFHDSTADKDTHNRLHKEALTGKECVMCADDEEIIENVWMRGFVLTGRHSGKDRDRNYDFWQNEEHLGSAHHTTQTKDEDLGSTKRGSVHV